MPPEEAYADFVGIEACCRNCDANFPSKSKLHKHLRQDCLMKPTTDDQSDPEVQSVAPIVQTAALPQDAFSIQIVDSDATDTNLGTGFVFRGWNYAHIPIRLQQQATDEDVCADTGCGVTLAGRLWLRDILPNAKIRKMSSSLRVKGLGSAQHDTSEYVLIPVYIPAVKDDGTKVLCRIKREIHLVDNLRAHMLIGNDIIGPEQIVLDVAANKAYIGSCNATATISTRQRGPCYTKRAIKARRSLIVAPYAQMKVPIITPKDLPDRDFLFEPCGHQSLTTYAHLVDAKMDAILVKNETDKTIQVPRKMRLCMLCEVDYENVFFAEAE